MSPEEMLLDPLRAEMDRDEETAETAHAAFGERGGAAPDPVAPAPAPVSGHAPVPPVRTIVLDRAPTPASPPSERASIREVAAAGPERLRLEDVSINYGAKPAVKSVSLVDQPG